MISPLALISILIILVGMGAGHTVLHRHQALQRAASLLNLKLNVIASYMLPWGWVRARLDGERQGIPLEVRCLWRRIRQGEYVQETYHLVARLTPRLPLRFGLRASTRSLLGQMFQREPTAATSLEKTYALSADQEGALEALLDLRAQRLMLALAGMCESVRLTPESLELELKSDGAFFRIQAALDRGAELLQHLRRPGGRPQLLLSQLLKEGEEERQTEPDPALFSAWLQLTSDGPERRAALWRFIEHGSLMLAVRAAVLLGEEGHRRLVERLKGQWEPLTPPMWLYLAEAPSEALRPLLQAYEAQEETRSPELWVVCLKLGEQGPADALVRQYPLLPLERRRLLLEQLTRGVTAAQEPLLRRLLRNQSLAPEEKQLLLRGLGQCGGPQTLVALRPFVESSEPALVRAAARAAMAQLRERVEGLVGGLTLPPGHAQVGALSAVEPSSEVVGRLSVKDEEQT